LKPAFAQREDHLPVTGRPTFKDLERRIKVLEEEAVKGNRIDEAPSERGEKFVVSFLKSPIPMAITTMKDGRYVDVNESFTRIMGLKRDELIGNSSTGIGFITAEDRALFLDEYRRKGYVENLELKMCVEGGAWKHGLFNSSKITIGKEDFFLTIVTDITERKLVEEALRKSEERFRAIADYTYGWENWVGPDGKFLWLSPLVKAFTGYSAEECLNMADFPMTLIHEKDKEIMRLYFSGAVQGTTGRNVEFRILCKDGNLKWSDVSWQPIYDKNGVNLGHRSSIRDVTEQKHAEETLRESEERYRIIVENTNDAIYAHDFEGNIINVNDNACRMVGYGKEELIGASLAKIDSGWRPSAADDGKSDAGQPSSVHENMERLLQHGKAVFERKNIHRDGSIVHVEVSVRVVGREGKGLVMGFVRNITDRKKAEQELSNYREELEELVDVRTKELEDKNLTLNELNIALKVLLQQKAGEKKDLEDQFVSNIQEIILPCMEKIKSGPSDGQQRLWLGIMEKNLAEIMSPLLKTVKQLNFTRQEIQIAALIREGKTTKEIASLMGVATKTIDTHRNRIRKKLGINKIKANLYTCLQSIS
jgi:PAS domain S-box-containing protein